MATVAIPARIASSLHTQSLGIPDDIPSSDDLNASGRLLLHRSEPIDVGFGADKEPTKSRNSTKSKSGTKDDARRRRKSRQASEKVNDDKQDHATGTGADDKRRKDSKEDKQQHQDKDERKLHKRKTHQKNRRTSKESEQDVTQQHTEKLDKIKQTVSNLVSADSREPHATAKYSLLAGLVDNLQKSSSDRDVNGNRKKDNHEFAQSKQRNSQSHSDLRHVASRLSRTGSYTVLPIEAIRDQVVQQKQPTQRRKSQEHRRTSSDNKVLATAVSATTETDSKASGSTGRSRGRDSQKKKLSISEPSSSNNAARRRRQSKSRASGTTRRSNSVGASRHKRKSDSRLHTSLAHLSPNSNGSKRAVIPPNTPRSNSLLQKQASLARSHKTRTSGSYNSLRSPAQTPRTQQLQHKSSKLRDARADSMPVINHIASPRHQPTNVADIRAPLTSYHQRQKLIVSKIKGPPKIFDDSFTTLIAIDRGDMESVNAPVVDRSVNMKPTVAQTAKGTPVFPVNRVRNNRGRRHSMR
ncbi:expressed unknown protein [Seminavis robusta]|uniref:Uncharacterized protein n=1 Tax=Seminavis robusta TaxID=568900 RepID=A0A9N8DSR7_9STRA|nr:expressed unknown protein [Seminavis robusta]|eukprot:Sro316_g115460.1 n/a (525) ;mRNA; r:13224-14798